MLWVTLAAAAVAVAGYVYLVRERLRLGVAVGLTVLRAGALFGLLALLVNAAIERTGPATGVTVALDASLSMQTSPNVWAKALDTAIALAGPNGRLIRFGDRTAPFDSAPPTDGRSLVGDALRLGAAGGGATVVITDGELEDLASLPVELRNGMKLVILPRDSVPGLAMTEAIVPSRALTADSIPITVELATWGGLPDSVGTVTVRVGDRVLLQRALPLPPAPGRGRRTFLLPPHALGRGTHVLSLEVAAAGDPEPRDNTRLRVVEVSDLPVAALVARPLDWEARFLARELTDLVPGGVQAFGDLGGGRWVDMGTQQVASASRVRAAVRGAAAVIVRGDVPEAEGARRVWRWPATGDGDMGGEWYVTADLPASPFVSRLAGVPWDSLPPVHGVLRLGGAADEAVLTARLARRGGPRAIVTARDSAGRREMVTSASGLWRWAFRGGEDREGYRALLGAGLEWLLDDQVSTRTAPLVAEPVVPRGIPIGFRWMPGTPAPDSLSLAFHGPDSTRVRTLRLGGGQGGSVLLPPGIYEWRTTCGVSASGTVAVEEYSPEFVPRPRVAIAGTPTSARERAVGLRELWWGFGLVMLLLFAEWGWRARRGLP
jgi:hypothetical protein